jgi:hypothetical protein
MMGFWMEDALLELWLRLMALHVREPGPKADEALAVRNQWLLASRLHFNGCVPHALEAATATPEGLSLVKKAILSLSHALSHVEEPLHFQTLNLPGFEDAWSRDVEIDDLRDVASAFIDLVNLRIRSTAATRKKMPGSHGKPGLYPI